MALRVWLPLNGNLNNQGLSNFNISGTASFVDSKFGQGKNLLNQLTFTVPELANAKVFSVAYWFKINTDTTKTGDWMDHICLSVVGSDGSTGTLRCENCYSSTYKDSITASWYNTFSSGLGSGAVKDEWYHMVLTSNGVQLKCYLNGVLKSTKDFTSSKDYTLTGYIRVGENNNTNGCMNDLRIYDECLNEKQIKEISKGLIAHYKLDTARAINNLRIDANYGVYNNFGSSGSTCTVVATGEYYNGSRIFRMTYTPNDTSLSSVQTTLHSHGVTTSGMKFLANTKYCYWTLCKPVSHPDTIVGGTASNIGGWTSIPMKKYNKDWYIVGQMRNGTVTEDKTDTIFTSFKTPSATSGTPIIIDFCCPHLIEGYDYIMPEFNYIGDALEYEPDSSGYNYNMNYSSLLPICRNSSARYLVSTELIGKNTNYLYRPYFNFLTDNFTFNIWVYQTMENVEHSDGTTTRQHIMSQGRDCGFAGFALYSEANTARLIIGTSTSGTYYAINSGVNILNGWHMITGTYDGATAKLYVDGQLKGTKETTDVINWEQASSAFVIGKMAYLYTGTKTYFPFGGYLNDARVYATALSADDILSLYKTSALIDSDGNSYAYEFVEEE